MIDRVLHHTNLKFRIDALMDLCNKETVETKVEDEWNFIWRLLCGLHKLNRGGERTEVGESATLHIAAKMMSEDKIIYKSNPIKQYYSAGRFSKLDSAPLFISDQLAAQTIRI